MALGASTGEGELICSKHTAAPLAKVTSADNVTNHELSSHQQAQAQATHTTTTCTTTGSKRKAPASTLSDSSDELEGVSISTASKQIHKGTSLIISITLLTLFTSDPTTNLTQTAKAPNLANEIKKTGPDAILKDIEVLDIDEPTRISREACSRDINSLFSAAYSTKDGKKV